MQSLLDRLSQSSRESLQKEFQLVETTLWVTDLARRKRWREANEAFLRHERDRGRHEMENLMAAVGVRAPVTPCQGTDLVVAAVGFYVGQERAGECIERVSPDCLTVKIEQCPVFRRIEENGWRGVTACGSWHRRRGWYEALGTFPTDTVLSESKWGDESCEALIDFSPSEVLSPVSVAAAGHH